MMHLLIAFMLLGTASLVWLMLRPAPEAARPPAHAIALSALVFAGVAPLVYVASRAYDYARGVVTEPQLLFGTTHTEFYWRVAIAAWVGLVAAGAAFSLLRTRDPAGGDARLVERLSLALTFTTLVTAVGALVFP